MQNKISTFLWFESGADDAAKLYCSIFLISRITSSSAMSTSFELEDQRFIALDGGPHSQLDPAISLFVSCTTQGEVDALRNKSGAKPHARGTPASGRTT